MIITSNDPKHRTLGKDIENVTNVMAFLSHIKLAQVAILSKTGAVLNMLADQYDQSEQKDSESLERLTELKFIMNNSQDTIERIDREFRYYQERFDALEQELTKLTKKKDSPK